MTKAALLLLPLAMAPTGAEDVPEPGTREAFFPGDADYPAGSWIIADQAGLRRALEDVAGELDLVVSSAPSARSVARHALDLPRLAVLQAWVDTEAPGWVRMILDAQKVPYTLIMDEDVRRGGLRQRFDVIVYPNTYRGLKEIATGIDPRFSPLAFTKTPEFPTHGFPTSSPDITYAVRRNEEGRIVMQWGARIPTDDDEEQKDKEKADTKEPLVVSGGVKGAEEIEGKPAILDIPTGRGRVVAFDFDPIHRYQTLGTFRLVWNAILNWNDLPPTPPPGAKGADDPDYRR